MNRTRSAIVGLVGVGLVLIFQGCSSQAPPDESQSQDATTELRQARAYGGVVHTDAALDASVEADSSSCREVVLVATKEADGQATVSPPMTFAIPATATDEQGNTSEVIFTFSNSTADSSSVSCTYHRSGTSYALTGCSNGADAGASETADTFDLHFTNANDSSTNPDDKHRVSLTLDETPPCGAKDSGADVSVDAPKDVRADVPIEAVADTPADVSVDVVRDAPADVPVDVVIDAPVDVVVDTGVDAPTCNASNCTPNSSCDVATCNGSTCTHTNATNGTSCTGTNLCNQTYTCQSGVCTGSNPVVCTASDSCHVAGTCAPSTGLCSNPTAPNGTSCVGTNLCEQTYTCQVGVCTGSNPVVCTANDQCHAVGTCNPSTGVCSNPNQPNGTSCTGTNLCEQTYACSSGICTGSNPVICTASDQCHLPGTCSPSTGICSNPTEPDGTTCTTGNLCFAAGTCTSGTCIGTSPVVCTASDQCHVAGTCNPTTGVCSNPTEPDGTACNDNNACTQTDACTAGVCVGSNPIVCTASDQCHAVGTCDPTSGVCSNPDALNGIPCNDGNLCDLVDTCQTGACTAGAHVVCTPLDTCHAAGTCNPATGSCSNPAIPGCDSNPIATAGVFEPNASLMGKVVDTSGNPFTSYTIQVFDAPMGPTPRTDVTSSVAPDGSFRARLTSFPTSVPPGTPPSHEIVILSSPTTIQVERDAYLHPTDAEDLGIITVVALDPNVTMIGPAGGSATDSNGLVSIDVPAGALTTTIPVRITPLTVRSWFPFPLPDGTATTYGVDFEPSGTQFSVPIAVHLSNTLSLPTSLVIPVGAVDAANARWIHEGFATWDGTRFSYTTTHFSDDDTNPPLNSMPKPTPMPQPNPNPPPGPCPGSQTSWGSGALRESIATPSYRRQGRDYNVTLSYDSSLTFGSTSSSVPSTSYGAVPHSSLVVNARGLLVASFCRGGAPQDGPSPTGFGGGGSSNPACANTSFNACTQLDQQFPGGLVATVSGMGGTQTQSLTYPAGATDIEVPTPVNLALDDASDVAASHFERQTITLTTPGVGACVSGGGPFGVQIAGPTSVSTNQDPGPIFTLERHVFVHHRHASPFGVGWAVDSVGRLYKDPSGDIAVLARGDALDELFLPRTNTKVVLQNGATVRALANDRATGQAYFIQSSGEIDRINPDGSLTAVLTGLGFDSGPLAADITYVAGVQHFVVALATRLLDIDSGGTVRTLMSRSNPTLEQLFYVPGVAAYNDLAFYAAGLSSSSVLYRFRLSLATPTAEPLTMASGGDIGLDPQQTLSGCTLGNPHGLAFSPTGELYVADRQRNVIYGVLPVAGEVGGSSAVVRVVGDGVGRLNAPIGNRFPGPRFPIDDPLMLSTGNDGTLWIVNTFGVAAFDAQAQEARWLVRGKGSETESTPNLVPGSELLYSLSNPLAQGGAAITAAGPTSIYLYDGIALLSLSIDLFSSEVDPTRTVTFDGTGAAVLTDTTASLMEAYDPQGRLIQRSKRTGEPLVSVSYVDSSSDRIAQLADPVGGATVFGYDGGGHLQTVTDPAGRVTQYTIDGGGDLLSVMLPDGETTTFAYAAHRTTQKTAPNGDVTTYTYASDGSLSTATKPAGEVSTLAAAYSQPPLRDANGKTLHGGSYVDTHGVSHTFTIDYQGDLATDNYTASGVSYAVAQIPAIQLTGLGDVYSDRANTLGRFSYTQNNGLLLGTQSLFDSKGRLVKINTGGSSPAISSSTFDANGFLSGYFQGPANDTFQITRDTAGHPTKIAEIGYFGTATGREVDYTWNAQGLPATITEHGVTTTYTYDANGNVLLTVDTLGRTTAMTYDAAGNVATSNDGQTTTTFTYDSANRLVTSTDALSNTTTYGYALPSCGCSFESLVTSIHTPDLPAGVDWTMQYGFEGRLSSVTNPDGFPESYLYQPSGELTQLTDRNGNITMTGYDQLGRVNSIIDALTRAHTRTYPVPAATGWTGPTLLSGSASSTAATTSLTGTLNPGDYQIGTNGYDFVALGVPSRGEPQVSLYQDATFQLSYGLQWDGVPRLTDKADRNGLPISSPIAFGSVGQTGANFQELTSYNPSLASSLPQLQDSTYSDHTSDSNFSYNTEFDATETDGWEPTDAWVTYNYGRDAGGRITSVTRNFTGGAGAGEPPFFRATGPSSTYAYYPNGYLQTRTDADGEHDYVYDTRGLVETITIPTEGVYTFGYDQLGRNTQLTFPDGHVRVQQYDQEGRITSRCYEYTGSSPTRCYLASYDPVGNPVTMTDPEGTDTLTYDALNRLMQVSRSTGGIEDYAFNTLGALSTNAGAVLNMQRPRLDGAGNADSAVPSLFNSLPVTLDGGGRITVFNGDTFVYGQRNELRSVTEGGSTELYGFDSFMRRVARYTGSAVNELYVYEADENITEPQLAQAAGQVVSSAPVSTVSRTPSTLTFADQLAPQNIVAALDASGGVVKSWLYDGVDHPLRVNLSGTIMYYEVDLAGNVRRLRDPLGNDLGGYRYTAFGQAYPADAGTPAPLIDQPLQWKARWFSPLAGGIYDVRARQWAPALGAFLSLDRFEFQDPTTALWGWPGESPVRFSDPDGSDGTDLDGGLPPGGVPPPPGSPYREPPGDPSLCNKFTIGTYARIKCCKAECKVPPDPVCPTKDVQNCYRTCNGLPPLP